MNEDAIKDAYDLFVNTGYNKSYDNFKALIQSNPAARKDAYDLFVSTGYNKTQKDFDELMGVGAPAPVKKKEQVSPSQQKAQPTSLVTGAMGPDGEPVSSASSSNKSSVPLWLQKQETPKPQATEESLPFMAPKPQGINLGSERVPEKGPMFGVGKPEFKEPEKIDKNLARLETSLVDMDEEQATEKLKYLFGDLGFTFDQAGYGYDAITVTSPSGKKLDLSWDNFSSKQDEYVLGQLTDFISKESKAPSNAAKLEKYYEESNKKFVDQREINETIATLSKKSDDVNKLIKGYVVKRDALENEGKVLEETPENLRDANWESRYNNFVENVNKLEEERLSVVDYQNNFEANKSDIDKAVGKYMQTEENMGWWGGVLLDSFLKGQGRVAASGTALFIDGIVNIMPTESLTGDYPERFVDAAKKLGYKVEDYKKLKTSLSEDQIEEINDKVDDELKKELKYKYGTLETARETNVKVLGSDNVTKQYEAKFKEGFFGGAIAGLTESLPSMLGPSPARVLSMYSNITDNVSEEMENDPTLSKLSETEKSLVSVPIGIVSAVLEEFGLRNVVANKGLLNKLVMRMLGKVSPGVTSRTFAELVRNDVESMVARGLLTVGGAALAEFETGAAQEASEQTIKAIYNKVKGDDVFKQIAQTPYEFIGDMMYAGAQEAVGGFVLGSIPAVSAAYRKTGFEGMSDIDFEKFERIANDDKVESAFVTSLKTQINSGEISVEDAKQTLNDYRKSRGLYKQLPDNLTTENKKKAMNLLRERQELDQQISGKDAALVKPQKTRIEEINSLLETISKPENNAVQEQATSEVPVQPGAPVGGKVAQGEPQAEPEVVTEEGQAQEEVIPGEKAVVSGIEITYPTEQEKTERQKVRNSKEYVSAKAFELPVITDEEFQGDIEGEFAMVTAENPKAQPLTEEENVALNTKAEQWLINKGYSPKKIVGKYDQAENSFFVKGMTKEDAFEFAKEFNQESVAHSDGMIYQNGKMNPRNKAKDNFETKNFVPGDNVVSIINTPEGPKTFSVGYDFEIDTDFAPKTNFEEAVNKSAQSLNMVAPGLKIIIAENTDDAQMQIAEALSAVAPSQASDVAAGFTTETRGQTVFVNGKPYAMVFNKETADSVTAGHEVWETLLNDAFADDQARMKEFVDSIDAQLRAQGFEDIADKLDAFASQRGYEAVKYSEYMAELGGMLVASGFGKGPLTAQQKTLLQKIGDIINKFAQLFTGKKQFLDQATPEDILGFMITISEKVSKGEDISQFFRGETPGATMDGGIISRAQIGKDSVDNQFNMSIEYNDSNMPDKLKMPEVEPIENVLKESGGAAVFINSDGTKVGMTRDNKKLQGGWRYAYFEENINDNIGFAATSEAHVGTFHRLIQQIASERDASNPEMAGKPVAVFVTIQNAESMLGEWYAGEFLMDGLDKAITEKKTTVAKARKLMDTAIVEAQKRYIDSERKASESKGDARSIKEIKGDAQYKQLDKLKGIIKEKGFDTHEGRIKAARELGSKAFSFKFRSSLLSELIPLKSATGKNPEIKKLLLDVGYGRKDFYKDTMDEIMYDALEKSNFKESSIGGTTLGGFYADPYVTREDFLANKNKGIQHEMFNESFSSNGKSFRLDKARNVNKLFPSMGFPDARGYKLYNDANNASESKSSGIIGKNKVAKWLMENGHEKTVTNPFTAISGTMYTSTIDADYQKPEEETKVTAKSQKAVPAVVDEVLTDDGKGNYVFVHYSDEKRDTIKPMSGSKKNFTSREEVAAISSVGGVAMYYTKQGQVESGVGNVPHTVLVPKDKVYFYGTTERGKVSNDPENFAPEARRRFQEYKNRGNESRPTEYAFDPNNAAAWVTKVAAENGYDMVVTNWGGPKSYRAQTVKELTPEAEYQGFKQIPDDVFEVGDEVFLHGRYGNITEIDGDVLTIESENRFGGFDKSKFQLTRFSRNRIMLIEKAKPTVTVRAQKKSNYTDEQYSEMSRNGILFHAGTSAIQKLDPSKIKGGARANYGWGVYFASTIFKASEYGDMITFLDSKQLNFLNISSKVTEKLISELEGVKDKDVYYDLFIDKLRGMIGVNINEARNRMSDFIRWDYDKLWSNMFMDAGYDGFNQVDYEYVVFNMDKADQAILQDPLSVTTRSQRVDVKTIPGYDRFLGVIEGMIDKAIKSGTSYNKTTENVIEYIQRDSAVYRRADDSQREQIIRDFVKIRGEKFKKAPSVARIMGEIKDTKEIMVKEKTALKDQIKLEAKAAKDAVAYVKQLRTQISTALRAMTGRGVISARQATTILARYDKMNILNPVMRDRFVDYMSNVLQRAEYLDKIREASKLRKAIKKASKSADNQAEVSKMAKDFAGIDPSRVEDIDQYIENATQVLNSAARKTGDPLMRNPVNMANMANYIEQEIEIQNEQIKNEILSKYQELVDAGVLSSDMTINEIKRVVAAIENNESDSQAKVAEAKKALKDMMEEISPVIMQMVRTGEDPFTGEPIELTYEEKKALKSLTEMDLDNLSLADAVKVVEYANNFVSNGITSGIVGMTELYNGSLEPGKLVKKGFKSIPIRKYFMKGAGKVWAEGFATLPMLNKLYWGDTRRAIEVSEASGVTGISNGKAKAIKIVDKAVKEYIAKFAKTKDFLASENVLERGMLAFMSRGVVGDEFQVQDEYNRRKSLIEETIQALKDPENSTDLEIAKGEVAQEVYDKILKGSKNAEEVRSKASKTNVDAVDWWINEWSKHYEQMDEVSRNVYNTLLSRDSNYTPDRFQLKEAPTATEEDFESSFFGNFEYVDTSKSGSLRQNNRITNLPEDKNGVKKRIVNLDFDVNNVNALTSALIDVETAGSVMKAKGFVTSKDFSKLFSSKEDRDLYKKRIIKYVSRVKGGSYVDQNELAKMNKVINAIASFGVAKALFSLSQPLKQFVPPMLNTLAQTGRFDIAELFKGGMEFIDNSGYPIANRGVGSQGELKSINRKLVEAEKNLALRGLDGVADFSNAALELTLKNPDIYAARASWISFYMSELKKQGIKPSSINWSTHKLNKQAADYAQSMVDSQQNISDTDMQGEIFASKQPATVFLRRALLPLMTFTLNQKTRIWADIRTIGNEVSSKEDKLEAKKSLAGALVELTAFSAISFGVKELLYMTAQAIFGVEEDDEEEEKKKRMMRQSASTAQNFLRDFFLPPIPGMDAVASGGVNMLLEESGLSETIPQKWFNIEDESARFNLYDKQNQGYLDMLGTQGIAAEKALDLAGYYDMAIDGKFTKEYKGNKVEKQILEEDRKAAALNALVMSGYYGGLLPSDFAYVVGIINKKIQKRAENAED